MPNRKQSSSMTSFHFLCLILLLVVFLGLLKYCLHQRRSAKFGNMPQPIAQQQAAFNFANQKGTVINRSLSPAGTTAAAIVVNSSEGSGTFYNLVGAMMKDGKEVYSTPILLGDRIKIVSVTLDNPGTEDNGLVIVHYLDRGEKDPMSADPTITVIKKYAFEDNGNLIGVLH